MSKEVELGSAYATACEAIKQKTTANVVEAARQGKFKIDEKELPRLVAFIQQSIDQAGRAASKNVLSCLKK